MGSNPTLSASNYFIALILAVEPHPTFNRGRFFDYERRDGHVSQQSSDTQSARALLIELQKRGVVVDGMDAEGVISLLNSLEGMQRKGWQFIPPQEAMG